MSHHDEGDDDLKLIRASAWAIKALKTDLPNFVRTLQKAHQNGLATKHIPFLKLSDRICHLLNIFQEDPLVLDPNLRAFIQELADVFLLFVSTPSRALSPAALGAGLESLSMVLYTFCKVRGSKVVTNLLNNEPRYLSSILQAYQFSEGVGSVPPKHGVAQLGSIAAEVARALRVNWQWTFRHILLLWTSHLMLTPFDLSTVAAAPAIQFFMKPPIEVSHYPEAAGQTLQAAFSSIGSATNEQSAAALALARISLRPDMVKHGLLEATINWAEQLCLRSDEPDTTIYEITGPLIFLSKVASMADSVRIAAHITSIYDATIKILAKNENGMIQSSAVAKKLIIKIRRHLVLHLLQLSSLNQEPGRSMAQRMLEELCVLEDVVDFLLRSLGDRDTTVRMAASKSLSAIAGQLEPSMRQDVVEAVLGSLQEDVLETANGKILSAVNPVRWHGLVLTLSHLLFRRSASPAQLGDVLEALFLALTFEQRSATGNSLGGNVRDAANFGLWSLARRYTTAQINNANFEGVESEGTNKTLQKAACELIKAATLDPIGNIRRGSSAALQELVGRHPDTIINGITLIQTVDFHSVGISSRAMVRVGLAAAKLDIVYRNAIVSGLMGWRGVSSPDTQIRQNAATSMGGLTGLFHDTDFESVAKQLINRIANLEETDIEDRHGLFMMLSKMVLSVASINKQLVQEISNLLDQPLLLQEHDLTRASQRPQLSVEAILSLFEALSPRVVLTKQQWSSNSLNVLTLCVRHPQEENLDALARTCQSVLPTVASESRSDLVLSWLKGLSRDAKPVRPYGALVAIGAAYNAIALQGSEQTTTKNEHSKTILHAIVDTLVNLSDKRHEIETRVVAIRSMGQLMGGGHIGLRPQEISSILGSLYAALNDYTINERGDIGSLLRLKAIQITALAGADTPFSNNDLLHDCLISVSRLAFEKLDKIRLEAAKCLSILGVTNQHQYQTLTDVSNYKYFFEVARTLITYPLNPKTQPSGQSLVIALIEGFVSSAGGGSDSIMPLARAALFNALDPLPDKVSDTPAAGGSLDLEQVANALLDIFRQNVSNDRVLVPLLETTSFLFDAAIFDRLQHSKSGFKWRTLLSFVQKSHFKTANMQKILCAVSVYRGMANVPAIRKDVLVKLVSMLAHPFPKVREAVAENLFVVTGNEELKGRDWSAQAHTNDAVVAGLKHAVASD